MGFFSRLFGPPTKKGFAKIMQDALHKAGDKRAMVFNEEEFRLDCADDGEPAGVVNLVNLFGVYCKLQGPERDEWLKQTCLGLANPMEIPEEFEDVKPDLYPMLRTRSWIDAFKREVESGDKKAPEIPSQLVSEHLVTCLVYDLPNSMKFVDQENLDQWGVTFEHAMEVARENLDQKQGRLASADDKVFICDTDDAYDATRMLKLDKLRGLPFKGDPIAIPVTRDCLLMAGSDDLEGLGLMAELAESVADNPRPICSIPHKLVGDQWCEWQMEKDHPLYEKFHRLVLRNMAGEYSEQKNSLDKLHEKNGTDIYVGTFNAMEKTDQTIYSYSMWSKGILTQLPKTDLIAFFDEHRDPNTELVTWESAVKVVGHLMQQTEAYPPRWTVSEFPTAEQIALMEKA